MAAPPRDQVETALADVLQEELLKGERVVVPGLGAFEVVHRSSEMNEQGDTIAMTPPRDEVVFTPEP